MSRDRNLALLGVKEGAGQEEIREAYERRLQKYESSDYGDDPEYVKEKIRELRQAYEAASRGSKSSGSSRGTGRQTRSDTARERREQNKGREKKESKRSSAAFGAKKDFFQIRPERTRKKGIIIFAIILFILCFLGVVISSVIVYDNSSDYYYDDYDNYDDGYNDYGYSYEDLAESDQKVWLMAEGANQYLERQDYGDTYISEDVALSELKDAGNLFVQNYTNMQTVEELTGYLYDNYGSYYVDTDDDLELQIDEILIFYGFMSYYSVEGRIDPYSGESIASRKGYLDYLNQFYQDNAAEAAESGDQV